MVETEQQTHWKATTRRFACPAIVSGETSAQLFVGTESLLSDVYGMKSDKQFINTLEDNIHEHGAPTNSLAITLKLKLACSIFGHWPNRHDGFVKYQ